MTRATHRVYLGAAPGVGKTYAMLNEGARRAARGEDVVIGWFEDHGRPETSAKTEGIERVPPQAIEHRGARLEEMDIDALLVRRPALALVDELAHTNVPGSRNHKRWQDVEELLEAGVAVISTVNIQHLESINDVVERITGVHQRETVPDSEVRRADQVELVDLTPEALRRRLARGDVYASDKVDAALANYFRPGNLGALRELALLWVADRVEESLDAYMEAHQIADSWETRERVVVAISGRHNDEALVRRASRVAARGRGELLACHVRSGEGLSSGPEPEALEEIRSLVDDLGGSYHEIAGADVASSLLDFARAEHATQLVLGASSRSRLAEFLRGSVINAVNRASGPIDIHIISEARGEGIESGAVISRPHPAAPPPRRRLQAIGLIAAGVPLLTLLMLPIREQLGLASISLVYIGLVIGVALLGGWRPSLAAGILAAVFLNYFFTEPLYTFRVDDSPVVVSLVVFVVLAGTIGLLVGQLGRRTSEAETARREAQALAYVAGAGADELNRLVKAVRFGFSLHTVALLEKAEDGWRTAAAAGTDPPTDPAKADVRLEASDRAVLVLEGRPLSADDRRVLGVLARQLGAALERSRLREQVDQAGAIEATDRLRTALLRAVSHDLRSPLASIKAAVTSLLAADVALSERDSVTLLGSIDTETDRLDRLVGNLLDMSRLQAGAVDAQTRPVGLEEVVGVVLAGLPPASGAGEIEVDVSHSLPRVLADPGLLERALANIVENAIAADPGGRLMIEAGRVGSRVDLRVVDSGPGIPAGERERVFAPFQRLGDRGGEKGTGLGLAVARGFVESMSGALELDDTPGGGLTVSISLPAAEESHHPAELGVELG